MYTTQFSENIVTIPPVMQEQMANSHNSTTSSEGAFPDTVEGYMEEFKIGHHMKEVTIQQMEYYFSPVNLPLDTQLQAKIDDEGFFSAIELASFPKVANLTTSVTKHRRIRYVMLLCIQSPQMQVDKQLYRVKSVDHNHFENDTLVVRNVVVGSTEEDIKALFPNPYYPQCTSCYPLGDPGSSHSGAAVASGGVVVPASGSIEGEESTCEWVLAFSTIDDAMQMYQLLTKRPIVHSKLSLFVRFKLKDMPEENHPSSTTSPFYPTLGNNNMVPSRPDSQHGSEWSYSLETSIQHPTIIQSLPAQQQSQQQQQQLEASLSNNMQQLQLQQPQPHFIYPAQPLALAPPPGGITLATPNTPAQQPLRQSIITPNNPQAAPSATPNIQLIPQNIILPSAAQYLWPPYVYDANGIVPYPFHAQPQVVYDFSRIAGIQLPNSRLRHQPTLIVGPPSSTILQQQQQHYQHQVYTNNITNAQLNQHATISLISNNNNSNNNQQQQHSNNSSNNNTFRQPRRETDRRQNHRYNNRNYNNNTNNNFHQQAFQQQHQQQQSQQQQQQTSFLHQPPPQLPSQSYTFSNMATHLQQQQQPQQQQQQQLAVNRYQIVAISRPSELPADNTHTPSNNNDSEEPRPPIQSMPPNNVTDNNSNNNRFPNEYNRQHTIQQQQQHQQQNRNHYNNTNNNRNNIHNQPQQTATNPPTNTTNNANTLPRQQQHQPQHQPQHQQQQHQQHVAYQQHPTTFHNPHFHGNHFQMPMQPFHQATNNWKPFPNQQRFAGYSRGGRRGGRVYEDNFNRNNPRTRPHQSQTTDFLENAIAFPPLAPTTEIPASNVSMTTTETTASTVARVVGDVARTPLSSSLSSSSSSSSHPTTTTEATTTIGDQASESDKKLSYAQIAQKGNDFQNTACYENTITPATDNHDDDDEDGGNLGGGCDDDTISKVTDEGVDVVVKPEQQHPYQHHHHHHQQQNYHRRSQNFYSQQQQQQQQQQPQQQNTFRRGGGGAMGQWVGRGRNNNKERIQQQ